MVSLRQKIACTAAMAAVFCCAQLLAQPATPAARWAPAIYHGLKLGSATRADVLRALGAPDAAKKTKDGEQLTYHARGEHKGDLTLQLSRAGVLNAVEEAFPVAIPRTHAYRGFGKDAVTAHYSIAACAGGALYRDPRGRLELTLYPRLGLMLWPDQFGYDFAAAHYSAQPPGLAHAPACVKR